MAKILMVDDDTLGSQIYVNKLTALGYAVLLVADGEAAVAQLAGKFDLIVLDIMVPRIGGVELLTQIKAGVNRATPVLVHTNLISDQIKQQCIALGANEYFLKADINPAQLVDKINSYIPQTVSTPAS